MLQKLRCHFLTELVRVWLCELRFPNHPWFTFVGGPRRAQQVLEALRAFHHATEQLVRSTCAAALATTTFAAPRHLYQCWHAVVHNRGRFLAGFAVLAEVKSCCMDSWQSREVQELLDAPHEAVVRVLDGEWHVVEHAQDRNLVAPLDHFIRLADLDLILGGQARQTHHSVL